MPKAAPYSDQKNWSNTYLTDPSLIKALGRFAVDPCCPPKMPWKTAEKQMITEDEDGLTLPWHPGRVFMNPPYRGVFKWARRFVDHGVGVALLNGRSMETKATQHVMQHASAVFFPDKRLTFYKVTGEPWEGHWFPSILIGLGHSDAIELSHLPKKGFDGVFLKGPRYS